MINRMILWSLHNRSVVLLLTILILVTGLATATRLPVEVLPDLTKPTVLVLTEAPGLAPEEVEARVTRPLERALTGVAGLTRLRSKSDVGLSLVYVEFDWDAEITAARMRVQERLQTLGDELPEGVEPFMTPVSSLMGEILLIGVRSTIPPGEPGYLAPQEIRTFADWTLRPQLLTIPGIAEVLSMGGGIRQLEIRPDPLRLQSYGITYAMVEEAAKQAAGTTTGGFLQTGPREMMIRNLAMTTDPEAIARTVVTVIGGAPVTLGDVAEVAWGTAPMRGDATISIYPEKKPTYGVIMSVTKAPGYDTRTLTDSIITLLDELQRTLPPGVETIPLFQQKDFIDHAIGNLVEAIRDGAIMVTIVLFLFLLNIRTTFITLMAMPVSFAITMLVFRQWEISVNSMTLGGLAVAIGMVVDDAIVDVENVYRRLRENATLPTPRPRLGVIAEASGEVRNSILYATLIIILVFLPLLGLSGVEGKLFAPIAIATIVSMIASFFVSLTLIPVLCSFLLRPKAGAEHRDGVLVRTMKRVLENTLLRLALDQPLAVLGVALCLLVGAFSLYPQMNQDFLPKFQEETALIAASAAPGTSLHEMNRIADAMESVILSVPEVQKLGRRLGRAERGDHVVPVSTVEFDIDFRDRSGQPLPGGRPRAEVLADIAERLKAVPGMFAAISGPLADRIGHMMSGVSAPVAVKLYGPDLDKLRSLGTEVQSVAQTIPGLESARLDFTAPIVQLRIEPDREKAAAYGLTPGAINDTLSMLLGGRTVGHLLEGEATIDLVTRLPEAWRDTPERIASLPLPLGSGGMLPLSHLAQVREAKGPNAISRENGQRQFSVAIQPSARDVSSLVARLQEAVKERVTLPEGYSVRFEGEFQAREEAAYFISLFFLLVLAVIVVLLARYFRSLSLALQVLVNIPLALMGGLFYTWLTLNNISIATLVGCIAVGGIAARNGIMMISHYLHLIQHEGEGFTREMIVRGTKERLVPVSMTALAAGLGLIPLVIGGDQPGKEILHPVAIVIVGGLVSSTLLDMAVTPAMFRIFGRKAALRLIAERDHSAQPKPI